MILGLAWDKMTPGVQAQVIRDILAVNGELRGVYWTGVELDATMKVLRVRRCTDIDKVTVWRTYQVQEQRVIPPTPVDDIPCVLYRETQALHLHRNRKVRRPTEQGRPNTFNPYDVPMPDPDGRAVDPRVLLVWT